MKLNLLTIMSLMALLLACNKKEEKIEPDNSIITGKSERPEFLTEGTEYVYDGSNFFEPDLTIRTVIFKELAKDTFEFRNYSEGDYVVGRNYFVWNNGALYTSNRLRDKASYSKVCDFDAPVGSTWIGGNNITAKIVGHFQTIQTIYGSIDDVTIMENYSDGSLSSITYVSRKYGIIGQNITEKENASEFLDLKEVSLGEGSLNVPTKLAPITFGNLNFLKVGAISKFEESSYFSDEVDTLVYHIVSKDSRNVFKLEIYYTSDKTKKIIGYWFEDDGKLMAAESNETVNQADILFISKDKVSVGDGWVGMSPSGTTFLYKVTDLDHTFSSDYLNKDFSSVEISVKSGFLNSQLNYWSEDIGLLNTDASFSNIEIISENVSSIARIGKKTLRISPVGGMVF